MRAEEIPKAVITFLKRPVAMILIAGLVIRLVLMPLLTYGYDVSHWALTIQHIQAGEGLYGLSGYWYTPVWGYILGIMSVVMNVFGVTDYGHLFDELLHVESFVGFYTATLTTPVFNFFVKIPMLISDVLVGYLVYRIIKERTGDERKATYGFALWFLCPLVIYTSSVHGMFDSIYVMFMVLSAYALYKGHDLLAGASLAVAVLLKVFPLFIIFVLIAYIVLKHKGDLGTMRRRILTAAIGAGVMALIIYIPQILDGTVMDSLAFFTSRVDGGPVSADDGVWSSLVSFGMRLVIWLQLALFAVAALLAYRMYKKGAGDKDKAFFTCLMVTASVIFIWPAQPSFLMLTLPFLICFIAMYDKRFIVPFAVLVTGATLHAVNNMSVFLSLAAYTDVMKISTVVSMMEWMQQPLLFGLSKHSVVMVVTAVIEVIGIILILLYWRRHEKEAGSYG
ncbi:MAG: glycosyltransferase 87 family protein [Methanomassiliicoccaceae archaeon]|nr:glycosyltransferase 87 family protein [Methanomassiliicoccaceae archaeon]